MEQLDLDITETNELTFKVQIEGADSTPANIRLVCEGNDVSYMFKARANREIDTFDFVIPSMKSKIKEGIYRAKIEVLLENKYFAPVEFDLNFMQPVRVVAEAVVRQAVTAKAEPKVSIVDMQVKKPESLSVSHSQVSEGLRTTSAPAKTLREKYSKQRNNG